MDVNTAITLKEEMIGFTKEEEYMLLPNNLKKKLLVDISFLENLTSIFNRNDGYDDLLYYKHKKYNFEKFYPELYNNPDIMEKQYPELFKLIFN